LVPGWSLGVGRNAPTECAEISGRALSLAGRWSPAGYRAALAGKAPPALAPAPAGPPTRLAYAPAMPRPQSPAAQLFPAGYAPRAGLGGGPPQSVPPAQTYVQVGLYRDRASAERVQRDLGGVGPVEMTALTGDNAGTWRVRIGPLNDAALRPVLSQVSARGVTGSTIVSE
jgi:cell division protein FtsN